MITEDELPVFLRKYKGQIRLAPLKMNIHILMAALGDDGIGVTELARILHHYPVISGRLIGLANSSWACPAVPVTNIETACIRLGVSLVKGVSIAIAVASSFDTRRCPSFDPIRFWTTSMLVSDGAGLMAAKLADKSNYAHDVGYTVQTAGILHNLGLLWLADNLAKEMEDVLSLTHSDPLVFVNQILLEQVGVSYCQVGAWIGKQWNLPEELLTVIQHHRNSEYQAKHHAQVLLVGAAAKMVSGLFYENTTVTEYPGLAALGVDIEIQNNVFQYIQNKFEATRELAKALLF